MVYLQYLNRFERNKERIDETDDAFEELDDDDDDDDDDFQSSY